MKRWPIIRHIRWLILNHRAHQWARHWGKLGVGLGTPNPADLEYLKAIWEGHA